MGWDRRPEVWLCGGPHRRVAAPRRRVVVCKATPWDDVSSTWTRLTTRNPVSSSNVVGRGNAQGRSWVVVRVRPLDRLHRFFTALEWWLLEPHNELVKADGGYAYCLDPSRTA